MRAFLHKSTKGMGTNYLQQHSPVAKSDTCLGWSNITPMFLIHMIKNVQKNILFSTVTGYLGPATQ